MAKNNMNWWLIIGIVIVVAVVVSLIMGKITGNTIKVSASRLGTEVYTKAEVDSKFNNLRSNSCDGDDFCEVKSILLKNPPKIGNISMSLGKIEITSSGIIGSRINLYNEGRGMSTIMFNNLDGYSAISGFTMGPQTQLIFHAKQVLFSENNYRGNGNAYVCIDQQGIIFRNDTACR